LFLEFLAKLVSKVKAGERFVQWIFRRTRKRSSIIERYEKIGLALFVAIPLPFTGAWTGAIAAFLLGLKFRYSMISITCGVLIAGAIVTALSLLGWVGAVIAGIALSIVAGLGLWRN
ncbi:MAG TPA: small multi-drug export protein, partial [Dehalococcoidia bacterium]|nr:small multi-drug export protein [Dehalococcoidia bacterium]